jgi:hypothetical protein
MNPESFIAALSGSEKDYRERALPSADSLMSKVNKPLTTIDSNLFDLIARTSDDLIARAIQERARNESARYS